VSSSHELIEIPVDSTINLLSTGLDPKLVYACECTNPRAIVRATDPA